LACTPLREPTHSLGVIALGCLPIHHLTLACRRFVMELKRRAQD
jgi:hypothetical protein